MKKLLSRLRLNLLTRIALALATVGLVPLVLATISLVSVNRDGMQSQVESTHALATRTTAQNVDAFLETRIALTQALAARKELGDPRSAAAQTLLRQSLASWAALEIIGIAVVTPTGDEAIRVQLTDTEQQQRVDAALGEPHGEEVTTTGSQGELTLRFAADLAESEGSVWVVSDTKRLQRVLQPNELGEQADLALAHSDRGVLLGSPATLDAFPPKQVERAFAGTGLRDQGAQTIDEFLGGHAPLELASWAVLSRQPKQVAERVAQRMERAARRAIGGALLAIGLLLGVSYATVVRPIRQLAAAQRRLTGGSDAAGGDEIAQLRSSFEELELRLRERAELDKVFLGRYQVVDVVGSGAMGTVFRGWDPKLERTVALKTIRLDKKLPTKKRRELVSQLVQEAITVAKFNHPNIVAVYDVEDSPEGTFVAMEFVDGNSLEFARWQAERLDPGQVIVLGAAVARGLQAAHEHGVVHRDVKPANVLLGSDGSIKVTDFGISELISSMTADGDVVFGTPGYLPPETLQGRGYDPPGDLFSLGVVMYYCLTGQRPFVGKTVREIVRKTMFGKVTPPRDLQPGIPAALDALVLRLLAKEPATRPQTAAQVAETLEQMARDLGLLWQTPPLKASDVTENPTEVVDQTQWMQTARIDP